MPTPPNGSNPPNGDPNDAQARIDELKQQVEQLEQIRDLEEQVQQLKQPSAQTSQQPAAQTPQTTPTSTPAGPAKKGHRGLVAALVAALIVLGGVGYAGFVNPGFLAGDDDTAQDIVLVSAAEMQDDPFADVPLAKAVDAAFVQSTSPTPAQSGSATTSGSTPGLYGGTMNESYCDVDQLIDFLEKNPTKAAAWVSAITSDPTAKLTDGRALTVDLLSTYIRSLTPIVVMADTRVTNHGFSNDKPTPFQSVLQKGTSALVDSHGVLRSRCWCGNPLAPAKTVSGTPKYMGKKWNGFDPNKVKAVTPSPKIITTYALTPLTGNQVIARPAGSTGVVDTKLAPGAQATTGTATGLAKAQHPDSTSGLSVVLPAGQAVTYDKSDDGAPRLNFGYVEPKNSFKIYLVEAGSGATIRDYGTDAAKRDAYINDQEQIRQNPTYSAACKAAPFVKKPITLGSLTGTMITAPACAPDPSGGTEVWGIGYPSTYFSLTGPNGQAISAFAFPDGLSTVMTALSSATFK